MRMTNPINCPTILALIVLLAGSTHTTNARCYVPTPTEAFSLADVVFIGKVLTIDDPTLPAQQLQPKVYDLVRPVKVRFAIERVLRGTHVDEIEVRTRTGGLEWGYEFEVRERYLVYAKENKDKELTVAGCGRSRHVTTAQEDLSFISGQNPTRSITPGELNDLLREQVGSKVKPAVGVISEPIYVLSDFNGDGFSDVAIVVIIEQGRDELKAHGVRYLDVDPFSRTNGVQLDPVTSGKMGQNCLGIVFLHGSAKEWDPRTISDKFIIYDCFSSIRRVPKGVPIRRGRRSTGPPPRPKGDSILLDLESGAKSLVYWDGKTYRGFSIRPGD
jgi:hypothetical protein